MDAYVSFLIKLLPIYALIAAGYIIGKKLPVRRESISSLLIYLVAPVVIFNSVYITRLTAQTLLLPIVFFFLCSFIALISYVVNKNVKPSPLRGVLAFAAGSGNTGYFGIPVALALFGEPAVGLVVLCVFGYLIYETTVGFFLMARGKNSLRESVLKLIKLPVLHAFLLAVMAQFSGLELGQTYTDFVPNFRGAYILLGSLLVGIALSELKRAHTEVLTLVRSFVPKFVVWPALVTTLILLDQTYFNVFTGRTDIYQVAFLMSIVPIAANTVAYATFLRAEPERAAFIVFSSTLFAIVYIPLMISFVLPTII